MFARALASDCYHEEDTELGGRPTFELAALADVSRRESHRLQLDDSFGDGALLNRLAPYRRMRESLIAWGYRFVPLETLTAAELIAPELRLLNALRERRLPYAPLGTGFEQLSAQNPGVRFDDLGFSKMFTSNNTPHEGAHAAIYEAALAREGTLSGARVVEALVAGEGFAMAFEFWLTLLLLGEQRRSTPIFFALNAAQNPFAVAALEKESPGTLRQLGRLAADEPAAVLKLFAAAGLIANVRPKARAAREELVRYLVGFAGLDASAAEHAKTLVRAAFSLDEHFRSVTAPTFFRFCGMEDEFHALCARPLEYHFSAGALFDDCLPSAIERVVNDGPSS